MIATAVVPVLTTSAVTAAATYTAWATELGVSTTASLTSLNGSDIARAFTLASAATVAGATYGEFSSTGSVGWSNAVKTANPTSPRGKETTDYVIMYYLDDIPPDSFMAFRPEGYNTTASAVKLQRAGGITIITGRITAQGLPTIYVDFAVRFSPDLAVMPVVVVTVPTTTVEARISLTRVDPVTRASRFISRPIPPGSWSVGYNTVNLTGNIPSPLLAPLKLMAVVPRLLSARALPAVMTASMPLGQVPVLRKAKVFPIVIPTKDILFGGSGVVEGFVTVDGVVAQRKVTLYDRGTKIPMRSQQSLPNGKYVFTELDSTRRYYVIGEDSEEIRESVIRDRIAFDNTVTIKPRPAFIGGSFAAIPKGTLFIFTPYLTEDMGAVVWSISAGTLPFGLSINSSSGVISGVTFDTVATPFTIKAEWFGGSASQSLTPSIVSGGDPYFDKVSLLLGTGYSTNIVDRGPVDRQIQTLVGATASTEQSKYGKSIKFPGSVPNVLLYDWTSDLHLDADFTIELWIFPTGPATYKQDRIINMGGGVNIAWPSYQIAYDHLSEAPYLNFCASSTNTGITVGSENGATGRIGLVTLNAWNHVAVTRSGNVWRTFLNGVPGWSTTIADTPYSSSPRGLQIGGRYDTTWNSGSPVVPFYGFMDDVRITKGVARYTAAFTPPDEHSDIWSDSYIDKVSLLLGSNSVNAATTVIDDSITANPVTLYGGAMASSARSKYGGASLYLAANHASYAMIPNSAAFNFASGDFTIETWIYLLGAGASGGVILDRWSAAPSGVQDIIFYIDVSKLSFVAAGVSGVYGINIADTVALTPNTWNHVAVTRQGNVWSLWKNGVMVATTTKAQAIPYTSAQPIRVGIWDDVTTYLNAYFDDLRVTKGVARYTAAFTPPVMELPGSMRPWRLWPITAASTWNMVSGSSSTTFVAAESALTIAGPVSQNFSVLGAPAPFLYGSFETEFDMVFVADSASRVHFGVFMNSNRSSAAGYRFANLDNTFGMSRWLGSTETQTPWTAGEAPAVLTTGTTYTFKVTRSAAFEFKVWVNGVYMGALIDSTYDGLIPGIFTYGATVKLLRARYKQL